MAEIIADYSTLLEAISLLPETKHISVVAISGFGGSGKSTLARRLAESLPDAAVVPADDFMLSSYHERSTSWDCIDRKRIIDEVLQPAEKGSEIRFHIYDWASGETKDTVTIGTPKVLILEGIGIIHPDLMPYLDFTIWVEANPQVAAERGMKRDKEVLHTDNDKLWKEVWLPNDLAYSSKYHPEQLVDYVYKPSEQGTTPLAVAESAKTP